MIGRLAVLLVCSSLACSSARTQEADANGRANADGSEFIARELRRCPLWTTVPGGDLERRKHITDLYISLAHYSTATLRKGIASYLGTYPALSAERDNADDKVFAFLRIVFKVPTRFNATSERLPFGTRGNPIYVDGVDLLWPYSMSAAGELELTGVIGPTSGLPYNPLGDFDQMASRLERRFPPSR